MLTAECERMDLQELVPGRAVAGAVCLRRKTQSMTKDAKPYLTVEVGNRSGSVSARIWSEGLGAWEAIDVGAPVMVTGSLKAGWKGGPPELVVGRVEPLARPHPVELELNPVCPVPLPELRARFDHVLEHMSPAGQELVRVVLEDVGEDDWWTAPAAKSMHHAAIRGLCWHSIECAELSLAIARSTPAAPIINWDALLVGALLHDVAKVREYKWRGVPIDLSREALLTYHTCSGGMLTMLAVERARARLSAAGVTRADVEHLCHVQLSHHGVAEFGSPVEPRTLEALIVHHADNVSARVRGMLDDLATAPADAEGWVTPSGWGRKPVLSLTAVPRVPLANGGLGARAGAPRRIASGPTSWAYDDIPEGSALLDERPMGGDAPLVLLRVVPGADTYTPDE